MQMKPMLAKPYNPKKIVGPVYLSPKLNGQRALWTGTTLITRTGKEILSVPSIVAELQRYWPNYPLDGELYIHGLSLQQIMKHTRPTKKINEHTAMQYHVYDWPIVNVPYSERDRILSLQQWRTKVIGVTSVLVTPKNRNDLAELNIFAAEGYEGTMIRLPDGLYKFGKRSGDLMKIKDFLDDEFEIVGITALSRKEKIELDVWEPGALARSSGKWYRNGEGTEEELVGSLICITSDGQKFEVGTGLDDATREELWNNPPIGKMLTVKYQNLTDTGIPFTPVFIAIRDYE